MVHVPVKSNAVADEIVEPASMFETEDVGIVMLPVLSQVIEPRETPLEAVAVLVLIALWFRS